MPAYNFKARFADLVESGRKRQTIRAIREDGYEPKVGAYFVAYAGMRTKKCRKLIEGTVTEVHTISLGPLGVFIDNREISPRDREKLAIDDGFQNWPDMLAFFMAAHVSRFKGRLIRWEPTPPTSTTRSTR